MYPSKDISAHDPVFNFARHLYGHEHNHSQIECPHECLACDYKTPYTFQVEQHIEQQGPFHNNKCPNCDERFSTRSAFIEHFKEFPNHQGYVCGTCETVFDDMESRTKHRRKEHWIKSVVELPDKKGGPAKSYDDIICAICGKIFTGKHAKQNHQNHKKRAHIQTAKNHMCDECGKKFKRHDLLRDHKQIHDKIPCKFCSEKHTRREMYKHIFNHHTENHLKPFICKVCNKGFGEKQKLQFHANIHTGIPAGNCKYCNKGFAHVSNLRMHEKTVHEGYKRSENSKKGEKQFTFYQEKSRTDNMQKCHQCGKVFTRTDRLNIHIQNVHDKSNQDEKVDVIPESVHESENARVTELKGEFTCEYCNLVLSRAYSLKKHVKIVHGTKSVHEGETDDKAEDGKIQKSNDLGENLLVEVEAITEPQPVLTPPVSPKKITF